MILSISYLYCIRLERINLYDVQTFHLMFNVEPVILFKLLKYVMTKDIMSKRDCI